MALNYEYYGYNFELKNEAEISFISERNFCTKRYFGMSLMKRSKVYSLKFGQY